MPGPPRRTTTSGGSTNTAAIIGGAVGGFVVVIAVALGVMKMRKPRTATISSVPEATKMEDISAVPSVNATPKTSDVA